MKNEKTKRMVSIALLMALVVVLQFVSAMLPQLGGFSISLVLIPVVLGAALYGPAVGALLGGAFGVIASINCVTGLDGGGAMVFQANPALCILVVMVKGVLAGAASGWVYALLKEKNAYIAMLCAAIVCPVVNTGVFLIFMLTFFADVLRAWAGGSDIASYILGGLLVFNFVPELAVNVLLTPASHHIIRIVKKNN